MLGSDLNSVCLWQPFGFAVDAYVIQNCHHLIQYLHWPASHIAIAAAAAAARNYLLCRRHESQMKRITAHHRTSRHCLHGAPISAQCRQAAKLTANKSVVHHVIKDSQLRICVFNKFEHMVSRVKTTYHERNVACDVTVTSVTSRQVADSCTTRAADPQVFRIEDSVCQLM